MPGELDIAELKNDLYKFERNLKWKLHFACQNPSSIPSNTAVAGTSNANPNLITIPQDTKIFENRKFKDCREGINIRRTIERKWIHKMKTNRSPGLNILD